MLHSPLLYICDIISCFFKCFTTNNAFSFLVLCQTLNALLYFFFMISVAELLLFLIAFILLFLALIDIKLIIKKTLCLSKNKQRVPDVIESNISRPHRFVFLFYITIATNAMTISNLNYKLNKSQCRIIDK